MVRRVSRGARGAGVGRARPAPYSVPSARWAFCPAMLRPAAALLGAVIFLTIPSLGCSDDRGPDVHARFALPSSWDELAEATFFDHPWPSDLRVVGGHPRWTGYYNPNLVPIFDEYIQTVEPLLDGFS